MSETGLGQGMKFLPPWPLLKEPNFLAVGWMLCISNSKQVLCTKFAGWNHLFWYFKIFFHFKQKAQKLKKKYKKNQKWDQSEGATPKHWLTPKSWRSPGLNILNNSDQKIFRIGPFWAVWQQPIFLTTQTHTIRRGALRFATQISPLLN